MIRYKVFLFICLFIPFSFVCAAPTSDDSFDTLKSKALSLRNTDLSADRISEWVEIGEQMVKYSKDGVLKEKRERALFSASVLYKDLYTRLKDDKWLGREVEILKSFLKLYTKSELVDDVLLELGDINNHELHNIEAAIGYYKRVVDEYPDSDMAPVSIRRLKDIDTGRLDIGSSVVNVGPHKSDEYRIVIDPGHGGDDFGGEGIGGLFEKDVVFDVALKLKKRLDSVDGVLTFLTRDSDRFIPLAERTAFANSVEADIFISLHSNASPKGDLSGMETFYLDNGGDAASRALAERENGAGGDIAFILSDLIQTGKLDESIQLSKTIHKSLLKSLSSKFSSIVDLGVRKAPFFVLVGAHMPCTLVELFFVDHREDAQKLADSRFRSRMADGIFDGIIDFRKGRMGK